MNKIAVITGCGSMDGKTLALILLNKGYEVILTYRRNSFFNEATIISQLEIGHSELLQSKLHFQMCDITDKNSVESCIKEIITKFGKIDELYMIAAMSHVGNSFTQKGYSIMANGQSYYYFLEVLKDRQRDCRVYGALTSELAGNVPDGAIFDESMIWHPKSPYAIGKALGGHWIQFYRESSDSQMFCCFGILFNHSNTYRSRDFFSRKITSAAAKIALGKQKELSLGGLSFSRDEHWSDFGCEMMWKMLQQDAPKDYVIGTGKTYSGEEYLNTVFGYFNLDWRKHVLFDKSFSRPNEVKRLVANSSLAQNKLGWRPDRMSFKEQMELLCKYDYALEKGEKPQRPNVFELFP